MDSNIKSPSMINHQSAKLCSSHGMYTRRIDHACVLKALFNKVSTLNNLSYIHGPIIISVFDIGCKIMP